MLKHIKIILFLTILGALNISGKSVLNTPEQSSESEEDIAVPETLRKFVEFVKKHDLNVSVIVSENRKGPAAHTKQELAITLHMPQNNKQLTAPTLDLAEQNRYLKEIQNLKGKEKVGSKFRVIPVIDGDSRTPQEMQHLNPEYIIRDTMNYKLLTRYENGKRELQTPRGATYEILYNYIIKEGDERNIQVLTGDIVIFPMGASPDTPIEKYNEELEKSLPLIWMSVDEDPLMAELLAKKLDQAFPDKKHEVLIGAKGFYASSKHWVKFLVADSEIVIFLLQK